MTTWMRPCLAAVVFSFAACGDSSGTGGSNPHLPEAGAIADAPVTTSDGPVDAALPDAPNMTCGSGGPVVSALPQSGSVSAGAPLGQSQFSGSCGGSSGAEVIYYVVVDTQLSALTFSTPVQMNDTFTPILYVRSTCDMTSSELGCQAATASTGATVTLNNPAMGTYFVFVDSPGATGSGSFTLTVSGTIPEGQACDPASGILTCGARHVCADRGSGFHCEVARCANGADDDGDGKIDFPHDPGCSGFEDDDESDDCNMMPAGPNCPQCGNRIDDDGDGKIDYDPPAGFMSDPGCSSANDPSEIDECIPGVMVSEFDANGHAAGNTANAGEANHFAPSTTCAFDAPGNDDVWHYRIAEPTRSVTATMTPPAGGFNDPVFYIRKNTCGDVSSEVTCLANFSNTPIVQTASNLAIGNDLYFFVDGELSGGYAYTVQLDVSLDAGAACNSAVTWKHCAAGMRCANNVCVRTQCADGMDNDGDGKIDYPNDPGCTDVNDDSENTDTCMSNPNASTCPQCGNGRDDDGDGLIDYPADPGCTSASDNDESDDCVPAVGQPGVMVTDITGMSSADGSTAGGADNFTRSTTGCGGLSTAPEKVYELRLMNAVSALEVSTCSSSTTYDTLIYIRKGSCLNSATPTNELGCNDDYGNQVNGLPPPPTNGICNGATSLQSYIKLTSVQAGIYFIFVDGYNTASGNFHLTVNVTP